MNKCKSVKIKLNDGQVIEWDEDIEKSDNDGNYVFKMKYKTFIVNKAEVVWILVRH